MSNPGGINPPSAIVKPASRKRYAYWAVAFLFAAVLLYFSLRGIAWGELGKILLHAKIGYLALTGCLFSSSLFLRACRWRVLLSASGEVPIPTAFWATASGYLANSFLPARAGEFVRSLMISSATGFSRTFVLTTAFSERLCDAITLVLISSVALLIMPVKPGWFSTAATPFAVLGLLGAMLIALLPRFEQPACRLLYRLPFKPALNSKLVAILEGIIIGLRSFHSTRRLFTFGLYTAVIWLLDASATLSAMTSINLHAGLALAFLLLTGLGLGSALPSTPGYVGIYQFVGISILEPFGFSKTSAIAYILLLQAVQYLVNTFWGVIGMSRRRKLAGTRTMTVPADSN